MLKVATHPGLIVHPSDSGQPIQEYLPESLELRNFDLDEYHRLIEIDFFTVDDRVELLEGLLVKMSPIRVPHANTVDRLAEIFFERIGKRARIRVQQPVTLSNMESEPEPDIVLAQRKTYDENHPNAGEILLLVEVSDSTLAKDRGLKARIYASESVQEYWIVNLVDRLLEIYQNPQILADGQGTYLSKQTLYGTKSVAPLAFPDCMIDVSEVLPKQR